MKYTPLYKHSAKLVKAFPNKPWCYRLQPGFLGLACLLRLDALSLVLIEDLLLTLGASSLSHSPPRQCFPREEVQTVYFLSEITRLTSVTRLLSHTEVYGLRSFTLDLRRVISPEDTVATPLQLQKLQLNFYFYRQV